MFATETFLTELDVLVDDFCKAHLAPVPHPGPAASLSTSEVVTLAVSGQWAPFPAEAACYRYARTRLRPFFPTLPSRPQFNRLVRQNHDALVAFALWLGRDLAQGDDRAYEALDGTGLATRNAKRRGRGGCAAKPTSGGAPAWGGTRACGCCWR